MDRYYRSGVNDFLVPKNQQDLLDRHPSPDIWSNWGISATEGFNSPNKFVIMDFNDESFNNQIELESSLHDKDWSSSSSVCGGLPEQSFQQASLSCDQPNFQFQDLPRLEQMDDFFLDSVPKHLPCVDNLDESFNILPENQCSSTPGGDSILYIHFVQDFLTWECRTSQIHAFFLSGQLHKDIAASNSKDFLNLKLLNKMEQAKVLDTYEQYSRDEEMHEHLSVEESILMDLEMVIGQFTDKTRISFRDALYRLARNTDKQQHAVLQDQEKDLNIKKAMPHMDHSEIVRSQEKKPMESETNCVDRVIANLMFNKMEFNIHGLPVTSSENIKQEAIGNDGVWCSKDSACSCVT